MTPHLLQILQEVISGLQEKMRAAADLVSGIGKGYDYTQVIVH